jgi:hypothetical protein
MLALSCRCTLHWVGGLQVHVSTASNCRGSIYFGTLRQAIAISKIEKHLTPKPLSVSVKMHRRKMRQWLGEAAAAELTPQPSSIATVTQPSLPQIALPVCLAKRSLQYAQVILLYF